MNKIKIPHLSSFLCNMNGYKGFIRFLPVNIRLLIKTYRFIGEAYAELSLMYTWEDMFALPAHAVYLNSGEYQIILSKVSEHGTNGDDHFVYYVSEELAGRLAALSRSNEVGFLFQQDDGTPFNINILNREFRKASRKARRRGIVNVDFSLIDLRAVGHSTKRCVSQAILRGERTTITGVSPDRIEKVRQILISKRLNGLRCKWSLEEKLRPLIAQKNFELTRAQTVLYYPKTARAAESRKRYWQKKGIWDEILTVFKE